jgi:two-component system, OmpR family, sensor kinase
VFLLRPRDWSLRTRLSALVVVLLAVTSVVIGGVMFYFVSQSLSDQFDNQLDTASQGGQNLFQQISICNGTAQDSSRGGLPAGTIIAEYVPSTKVAAAVYVASATSCTQVKGDAVSELKASITTIGDDPRTLNLTEYGDYRFVEVHGGPVITDSAQIVVGLPLSTLEQRITRVLVAFVIVVLAAMALAALVGALVVGRALRPLKRVAGIATDVSHMQLERGDVQLAERVPEQDTNRNTEVGQVGAALNSLLDSVGTALAVRQASEEKVRHFVADASHELRTPLASIRGYAELTRRFGGDLGETVSHNIDRIESESVRMTSLVEDLLLLARLDSQRELDELEVDLSRMLVDVVSDAHAAGRDHVWDVEIPEEPVLVIGDEARLQQVFTNLLANARVHTPAGTHVSVELREPRDGEVVVVVRDSGPGIPPELVPTMFERFVRGDSSRNRGTGSTGLGLSIVSAVTQAHHGSVTVESEPGRTEFTVRLPAAPVAQPA